jgi:hypothetical protein
MQVNVIRGAESRVFGPRRRGQRRQGRLHPLPQQWLALGPVD